MRHLECDCGSPSWRHHEPFCPRVTGVPSCPNCGEFHTGRCEPHTICCEAETRCRDCPEVRHAA